MIQLQIGMDEVLAMEAAGSERERRTIHQLGNQRPGAPDHPAAEPEPWHGSSGGL